MDLGDRPQTLVEQGCIVPPGLGRRHHRGYHLVFHGEEGQDFLGNLHTRGGHGRECTALVQAFGRCQAAVAQKAYVVHRPCGDVRDPPRVLRQIGSRKHGMHAGMRGDAAGVDGRDPGKGMRTTHALAVTACPAAGWRPQSEPGP